MTIPENIRKSEKQYLDTLEKFFLINWGNTNLYSHDLSHHRRVWKYAKELLLSVNNHSEIEENFTDKLIIACYLHDIGMSVDPGARHGRMSRDICEQFLIKNTLPVNEFSDTLAAVENHDNKEYRDKSGNNLLLTFLSAADDLDAFGYTGIYRYSEIYLMRGINPSEIGYLIQANASGRFDNFSTIFGDDDELRRKHNYRYEILSRFFSDYNVQAAMYDFGNNKPEGICGIIDIFCGLVKSGDDPEALFISFSEGSDDPVISSFFRELRHELSCW